MMLSIGTGLTFVKNYVAAVFGGNTSYNPVHVFGSDLVTWYGNSVEELWAEHRACWEDSPELVVNGGFDSADGWTLDAGVTVTDGVLSFNTSTTRSAIRASALPLVAGRSYRVEVTVTRVSGSIEVFVGNTVSGAANSTGKHSFVIVSSAANQNIQIRSLGAGVFTVDNLSVKEIDFSKSRLFSDNLGTTPITALEQTVGLILDKSKGLELGPELVTNGDFAAGTSGWTGLNATLSASNGVLRVTKTTTNGQGRSSFAVVAGRSYAVSATLVGRNTTSVSIFFQVGSTAGASDYFNQVFVTGTASGTVSGSFLATVTGTAHIQLYSAAASGFEDWSAVSVRELPGHHLSQPTATARGRLSARYNLLTNTVWGAVTPTGWTDFGTGPTREVITMSNGQPGIRFTGTNNRPRISQALSPVPPVGSVIRLRLWIDHAVSLDFPLRKLAQILQGGTTSKFSAIRQENFSGPGWYETTLTVDPGTTSVSIQIGVGIDGNATDLVEAGLPDVRLAAYPASWPQYQRVTTASDYDTLGFPARLVMDGVDDRWVTGNIDFTSASELIVVAVARANPTNGWLVNYNGSNSGGSFRLRVGASGNWAWSSAVRGGGGGSEAVTPGLVQSSAAVLLTALSTNPIQASLRVNAQPTVSAVGAEHTPFSGSFPLHVGQQASGGAFFNGDIFSLPMIVRRQITTEERFFAEKAFGKTIGVLQKSTPMTLFGSDVYSWHGNTVDEVIRAQFSGGPVVFYQDQAGTVPVTEVGQDIGLVLDLSGNGNHLRLLANEYIYPPKLFHVNGEYAMGTNYQCSTLNETNSSTPVAEYSISLKVDPNEQGWYVGLTADYEAGNGYPYFYFDYYRYYGDWYDALSWSYGDDYPYIETGIPAGPQSRVISSSSTFVGGERRLLLHTNNNLTFTSPAFTTPDTFSLNRSEVYFGAEALGPDDNDSLGPHDNGRELYRPVLLTSLPLIIKRSITDFERAQIVSMFTSQE